MGGGESVIDKSFPFTSAGCICGCVYFYYNFCEFHFEDKKNTEVTVLQSLSMADGLCLKLMVILNYCYACSNTLTTFTYKVT